MNYLNDIGLNILLIMFPLMIYFIYTCCQILKNKKCENYFLGFALISSTYLCLRFGNVAVNDKVLLFCNIPIIVAYLKKEEKMGIILSITTILYSYFILNYDVTIMIVKYLSYFITYLIVVKKNNRLEDTLFIQLIAVLQGFFLGFEYFFRNENLVQIMDIFITVAVFFIVTFGILYLLNLTDKITSLYSSVQELEHEKQLKNSLFKITHEIKNPIAVCKGYLDMLDINNHKKVEKYFNIIKQEINRCLNLMNDFMEFSKIKIDKDIIDINLLMEDFYDSFKLLIDNKSIKFIIDSSKEDIFVLGDYNRLKQVLLNIVKNSMEAIDNKGRIILKCYINNNYCYMEIIDNGKGMSKEDLSKIKEIFYTTKNGGSGIGVSLSNEIIKAHDGELLYESVLNKGTTTKIKLPIYNS